MPPGLWGEVGSLFGWSLGLKMALLGVLGEIVAFLGDDSMEVMSF